MKIRFVVLSLFLLILSTLPVLSGVTKESTIKYAEIIAARVSVQKTVEPKAEIVVMARAGDVFEIVSEGTLWIEVTTDGGRGWVPITACRVVDRKSTRLLSSPMHTIAFVSAMAVGLTAALFLLMRRKNHDDEF